MKVLLAGESWITHTLHIKGADHFTESSYSEGVRWLRGAIERSGGQFEHLPSHRVAADFPSTPAHLVEYDVVILSDIGSNSLLLHPDTVEQSMPTPNRLAAIAEYVRGGGALLMIGGYMSFEGIEGKARYAGTPIENVLPVTLLAGVDDRREVPEGFRPRKAPAGADHPVLAGLPDEFPTMLFYNAVRAKPAGTTLLERGADPILVVWECGNGRTAAFAPDAAPHGATPEFLEWTLFDRFWQQLLGWLAPAHDQ
jgi:uncharacterized membrane protein